MDVTRRDDLAAETLAAALPGRPLRSYPALLSTHADALAWARAGGPAGVREVSRPHGRAHQGDAEEIDCRDDDRQPVCANGVAMSKSAAPNTGRGSNYRLTEFQAALLLVQMTRLDEQFKRRDENAAYLTRMLQKVPGIKPTPLTPGGTRSAYHLYFMRYDKQQFAGVSTGSCPATLLDARRRRGARERSLKPRWPNDQGERQQ